MISKIRQNTWTPDDGFAAAYDTALQPTGLDFYQQYRLEIDYVQVSSAPLPLALLLFPGALTLLAWGDTKATMIFNTAQIDSRPFLSSGVDIVTLLINLDELL